MYADDISLMFGSQQGDRSAFDQLIRRHRTGITRHCARFFPDWEAADAAAQDVFIRAWEKRASFRGDSSVATWLYRLATNLCLNLLRNKGLDIATLDGAGRAALAERLDPAPPVEEQVVSGMAAAEIMAQLEPIDRILVWRHFVDGEALVDISRALGLPAATVRSRVHRLQHKFRVTERKQTPEEAPPAKPKGILGCFTPKRWRDEAS